MIKTVLFNLDGTLLPMNQDLFVKDYLQLLSSYFIPYGYDPKQLSATILKGLTYMIQNNGNETNEHVFFKAFNETYGNLYIKDINLFEQFYHTDFQQLKKHCHPNPIVQQLIKTLKDNHIQIIIATNPLFPQIATSYRIQWANINKEDLLHFTTYEDYSFTKPSLNYYQSILDKFNLKAEECLMVGNDVDEDMIASKLGIDTFLITDCLINKHNKDISQYNHGHFNDLIKYITNTL